jgi:hypothetical protein
MRFLKPEFRPKSLFGKVPYIGEQSNITAFIKRIGSGLFALEPIPYIKRALTPSEKFLAYPPPSGAKVRPEFFKEETRLELAKKNFIEAKQKLEEIGV